MPKSRSCPEFQKFGIDNYKCPYPSHDCQTCELLNGKKEPPETIIPLPANRGKTDFDSMTKEQIDTVIYLIQLSHGFEDTENKAYAMKAFTTALGEGLYPPLWALQAIGDVFNKFLKPTTKRSIDNLFGCGPGRNLRDEMLNQERKNLIRWRIDQEYTKGVSLEESTATIEGEDGVSPGKYEHIAKEDLSAAVRLNRSYSRSIRKKMK
jgi:hypothetical protein